MLTSRPKIHALASILVVIITASCGGSGTLEVSGHNDAPHLPQAGYNSGSSGFPSILPVDAVQPWELAGSGSHGTSAVGAAAEFMTGAQEWDRSANATDSGDIMQLDSAGATSWVMYRIPLGGEQPGLVSTDVNLHPHALGGTSEYWVGTANYGENKWDWHGPFTDSHVRLSTAEPGASLVSTSGSVFVTVVADGGSRVDVVGVGVNPADAQDTEAPPQVSGLSLGAHAGALELNWNDVVAGDLAGYRVYHSDAGFFDGSTLGVRVVDYLIGGTTAVVPAGGLTFVRIAAVDNSGNEGPLSEMDSAEVPEGAMPEIIVEVDQPSVLINDPVQATASGADSYDWDLNGDGTFDVTGDNSGTQVVDTSATGIIRPLVRAHNNGGTAVAHGGVSVIVASNSRPVVQAYVDTAAGPAPLAVNFSSVQTDFDGTISEYVWFYNGNTSVSWRFSTGGGAANPPQHEYLIPGLYNAKVKVWDDSGAWDVDSVAVLVTDPLPGPNDPPAADLAAEQTMSLAPFKIYFDASGSSDSDGSIVLYEWDFNGDGAYESQGPSPTANHTYASRAWYTARVRVTDDDGDSDTAELKITLPTEWTPFNRFAGNTGQSPYTGPQTNNLAWSFPTAGGILFSSPSIGIDGTIYIGGGSSDKLFAINPDGTERWSYITGNTVHSSPVIADDGTIYIGSYDNSLYALRPDGNLKWSVNLGNFILSTPCIGPDGFVYVGTMTGGDLYSLYPDGSIRWIYNTGREIMSSPVVGKDGTVYFGVNSQGLFALNSDGSLKWSDTAIGGIRASAAIGPDGNIYIGCDDENYYSYSPDGTQNWAFPITGYGFAQPAFTDDGNIIISSQGKFVYSITPGGVENWSTELPDDISSGAAIGADGVIYVGCFDGFVYALNSDGSELWSYDTTTSLVESSFAISRDGVAYIGDGDGNLLAIGP